MDDKAKEAWKDHAKQMENMRNRRRFLFREVIRDLEKLGFEVEEVSRFQYRINGFLDIYPSNRRFCDLKTHERGDIRGVNVSDFIKQRLGLEK